MNQLLKSYYLPWYLLGAGLLGAVLRLLLFATGMDQKGLLASGHWAAVLIWVLTAGALALLIYLCLDLKQAAKYSFNFPAFLPGSIGAAMASLGVLVTSVSALSHSTDTVTTLCAVFGLLSAGALAFLAYCRYQGLQPSSLFPMVICVYLMLRLVCQYRAWSWDPQIMDYFFCLMATVSLMLASYYDACFCAHSGNRRMHTVTHLAAVYFCLVSLPRSDAPVFYPAMAAWMFTNLCSLTPLPRARR